MYSIGAVLFFKRACTIVLLWCLPRSRRFASLFVELLPVAYDQKQQQQQQQQQQQYTKQKKQNTHTLTKI